ncbi:MAG: GYD domain-containing protein [Chloroflexota bacterium]
MATYILLGTLTDEGAQKLREHPEWIEEVNRDLEATGVQVIAQYAVLGPYDIVNIVEAPDNRSVVRVSTELTLRGSVKITTLPALPIEDFLATLK